MNASYRIRPARLEDSPEIAHLSGELGYPATAEEIRANLRSLLESSGCFVAVASGDGSHLSGWLVAQRRLTLESGEKAEITGLVVTASARRTGVGRALVSAAERWTVQQGFSSIWVRSNITRAESHPFYERLGYIRKKTQHLYEKRLSADV
jgi:GNAT superfamily N-acetyltransferase